MTPVALTIVAANSSCVAQVLGDSVVLREFAGSPPIATITCADGEQAVQLVEMINGSAIADGAASPDDKVTARALARDAAFEIQEVARAIHTTAANSARVSSNAIHGMTARIVTLGDIVQDALDLHDDAESCLPLRDLQNRFEGYVQ